MDNQNMNGTAPEEQQEKTFTQEQVNAIVGKRLAEQKQQHEAELVKREQELTRREMSVRAKELLSEKGLSKELADVLRYDSEDELVKAIETIEHARGFRTEEKGEYQVLGDNRLPEGNGILSLDPIAQAFRVKGLEYGD